MSKGSRDRTSDYAAYRSSKVWENMGGSAEHTELGGNRSRVRLQTAAPSTSSRGSGDLTTGSGPQDSRDCSGPRLLHVPDSVKSMTGSAYVPVDSLHPDLPPGVNPEDVPV